TQAKVDAERGAPTRAAMRLGLSWGDITGAIDHGWHAIRTAAEDAYQGATKIVVSLGKRIEVSIHRLIAGAEHIAHVVVASAEAAFDAVAGFFKQLYLDIKRVILF